MKKSNSLNNVQNKKTVIYTKDGKLHNLIMLLLIRTLSRIVILMTFGKIFIMLERNFIRTESGNNWKGSIV